VGDDVPGRPAAGPEEGGGGGELLIQGYHAGGFTIGGVRCVGSLLVLPGRVLPWPVAAAAEATLESLEPLREVAGELEILLLGTGERAQLVPVALRRAVRGWGPVVEPMTTPAACRTYNVLLSEDRRVAAALVALAA
jgi:uncharacterized protein